ncbi:bifunctional Glutaredoxin/Thioredoxin-like superfamily/Monothiol glutaredoxin-related [Babesia duncani]|uniref:Bifunctional Glutaredoxin/Thioredoxin-like superfamily/Monothiol glutaredoxin-related n=1 Tax=Babesia duncani TaxID=323732 RepID=A0AAD9PK01_9APIC|nr:bifunctional Glutaredoxin/Thioredoxin-like superfamily/Monothiol glutaredoxin-related [Babesia duncani]
MINTLCVKYRIFSGFLNTFLNNNGILKQGKRIVYKYRYANICGFLYLTFNGSNTLETLKSHEHYTPWMNLFRNLHWLMLDIAIPTKILEHKRAYCEGKDCKKITDPKDCILTPRCEARIIREIRSYPVVLFIKGTARNPTCKHSKEALRLLMICKVDTIRTVNVLEDPELREGLKKYSNYPYIPQLYVKGKFIGGVEKMKEMYENSTLIETLNLKQQYT